MTTDKFIFGLRFKSNNELLPSSEDLSAFLASPKKAGALELHNDDLAHYNELINSILAFDLNEYPDTAQEAFQKKMFLGVLAHSNFVKPALKSAVEQYKYHLHTLALLDPKKPLAFIKSAEEEMARLNPKKKEEAARLARMQIMVDERKKTMDGLIKHWTSLVEELGHLALYIKENLVKIGKLCEESIVLLVSEQIERKKEIGLIEDIKIHFKERLRESLHQGTITKEQLEAVKEEVADLAKRTTDLLRVDVYTLTGLYEGVHDHAKKITGELDALTAQIRPKRVSLDEDKKVFARIEQVLVSLITTYRFELKTEGIGNETEHDKILFEKRKEMLDHLFNLLRK
jgi:CRISPR/Cas system-associated endoribonuclease Cas2